MAVIAGGTGPIGLAKGWLFLAEGAKVVLVGQVQPARGRALRRR